MTKSIIPLLLALASSAVLAKLPALSEEAKGKAAEAAAKTAWSGKTDGYLLCKWQDKVAASYYQSAKTAGKATKPPAALPPCTEPGPFAYTATPPDSKPLEAAGAHSPATTATSPPSGKQPDAVVNPAKKS